MKVTLYSGPHCCLCDKALLLLSTSLPSHTLVDKQDVKSDPALFHLYGARIPVLQYADKELEWPFDENDIKRLIA